MNERNKLTKLSMTTLKEDLELAEDIENVIRPVRYKPGYQKYLNSPKYRINQFLDQLDDERRFWK